jgi:hypothetical protein
MCTWAHLTYLVLEDNSLKEHPRKKEPERMKERGGADNVRVRSSKRGILVIWYESQCDGIDGSRFPKVWVRSEPDQCITRLVVYHDRVAFCKHLALRRRIYNCKCSRFPISVQLTVNSPVMRSTSHWHPESASNWRKRMKSRQHTTADSVS